MSEITDNPCAHGLMDNPHCPVCIERRWFVYIIECFDGTLYTGIAKDVAARVEAHCLGKGAKYTRGRGPLILVYEEQCRTKSYALKREHAIKKMKRAKKKELIGDHVVH